MLRDLSPFTECMPGPQRASYCGHTQRAVRCCRRWRSVPTALCMRPPTTTICTLCTPPTAPCCGVSRLGGPRAPWPWRPQASCTFPARMAICGCLSTCGRVIRTAPPVLSPASGFGACVASPFPPGYSFCRGVETVLARGVRLLVCRSFAPLSPSCCPRPSATPSRLTPALRCGPAALAPPWPPRLWMAPGTCSWAPTWGSCMATPPPAPSCGTLPFPTAFSPCPCLAGAKCALHRPCFNSKCAGVGVGAACLVATGCELCDSSLPVAPSGRHRAHNAMRSVWLLQSTGPPPRCVSVHPAPSTSGCVQLFELCVRTPGCVLVRRVAGWCRFSPSSLCVAAATGHCTSAATTATYMPFMRRPPPPSSHSIDHAKLVYVHPVYNPSSCVALHSRAVVCRVTLCMRCGFVFVRVLRVGLIKALSFDDCKGSQRTGTYLQRQCQHELLVHAHVSKRRIRGPRSGTSDGILTQRGKHWMQHAQVRRGGVENIDHNARLARRRPSSCSQAES
jgi:hypothetical protein